MGARFPSIHYFIQMSQCKDLSHNKAHFLIRRQIFLKKTKRGYIIWAHWTFITKLLKYCFFITAEYTRNIAFSAKLTHGPQSGILTFVAFFSVGRGFDNETHVFTAPTSGTYFFAVVIINLLGSSVTDHVEGGGGDERTMPLYRSGSKWAKGAKPPSPAL